jgi:hypothetical protein
MRHAFGGAMNHMAAGYLIAIPRTVYLPIETR